MLVKVVWPFIVDVNNRGVWQFRFHGVHFSHDSRTPKMVDHGVTKVSLPHVFQDVSKTT